MTNRGQHRKASITFAGWTCCSTHFCCLFSTYPKLPKIVVTEAIIPNKAEDKGKKNANMETTNQQMVSLFQYISRLSARQDAEQRLMHLMPRCDEETICRLSLQTLGHHCSNYTCAVRSRSAITRCNKQCKTTNLSKWIKKSKAVGEKCNSRCASPFGLKFT